MAHWGRGVFEDLFSSQISTATKYASAPPALLHSKFGDDAERQIALVAAVSSFEPTRENALEWAAAQYVRAKRAQRRAAQDGLAKPRECE